MTNTHDYTGLEANAGERSAWANGYEAGLVAGIAQGIAYKMKGIHSIVADTSLTDNQVRLLLKRMCRLELLKEQTP
jgi:hypothetical protein